MGAPRWDCLATTRRCSLALALAVLAGCASLERDLQPVRDSWQGASYDEVVAKWGKPARSNGDEHSWYSETTRLPGRPTVGVGIGGGSGIGFGVFGGIAFGTAGEPVRCDRILTFRDGKVAAQRWLGPADYCASFGR